MQDKSKIPEYCIFSLPNLHSAESVYSVPDENIG